jgi:ring-1,2-phenylacetyl-CoA epoxidase subunit PaaC
MTISTFSLDNAELRAALKNLLFKMADDCLILGHRNSEWVGIGPVLEEDIAFASIAQDKLGHALGLYTILHEHLGEPDPDTLAFMRSEKNFLCCHLVELPTQEYDLALARHFFFDYADKLRFEALATSAFEPLAQFARKVRGEIAYHTMHAGAFVRQLGRGATEEGKLRMQSAVHDLFPLARGIFESFPQESALVEAGIFIGEKALEEKWREAIAPVLDAAGLTVDWNAEPVYGGRCGYHTEHLQPLLTEMSEVFAEDPTAEW